MLVFIAGRFVLGVTGWEALGVEIAQAIIWACLALSVVFADVAIHWKEIRSQVLLKKLFYSRRHTLRRAVLVRTTPLLGR